MLIAIVTVSYYYIIKEDSNLREKYFSFFSLVSPGLIAVPFYIESFSFILSLSLYLPFLIGVLGVILGWFGIKGNLRISLIGINSLALGFYLVIFLMATVGFQEP